MNKLELEMSKSRLGFHKEIIEDMVKMDKNCLWLNRIIVGVGTPVVILLIVVVVGYIKDGKWILAMIELLLALLNGGLCITAIDRNNITKRSLNRHKDELEQVNSDIKLLEEMDLE